MSSAAKNPAALLMINNILSLRRQSKRYRKHDAASGKYADVVGTGDGRRTGGGEGVDVAGAVGLDRLDKSRPSDGVAGDVVLVEQVIEAQAKLGLVEAPVRSDR